MKLLCLSLACVVLIAPSEDPPAPAKPVPSKPALTGRVVFDGPKPEVKDLPSKPEQTKGCCPDDKAVNVRDPSLVVDDKGGLANVLVVVDAPAPALKVPETPFVLDQRACVFEPHCLIVPAGAKVIFKNSDTISHNVHVYAPRNDGSNNTIAAGGQIEATFAKPDKVRIACDYHPWMSSLVLVVDTPWCALTQSDGTFKIEGVPPGTYKLKLWHESLGRGEGQATVNEDGTCAPLAIKMASSKKKP